jgi:hypothetical protein
LNEAEMIARQVFQRGKGVPISIGEACHELEHVPVASELI